jgi:AmmeMemoRadiSam system protein A
MSNYTKSEQKFMLDLARNAISKHVSNISLSINKQIPAKLQEKRACFVTLTKKGTLRGCIGHILAIKTLYEDIIENAKAAAFDDPRFAPVTNDELEDLTIEISVLTVPKPFLYATPNQLTAKLAKDKPGVILKSGPYQATFLPQVWEDLPSPEEFLSHLAIKAGLSADSWKNTVEILAYGADVFKERDR